MAQDPDLRAVRRDPHEGHRARLLRQVFSGTLSGNVPLRLLRRCVVRCAAQIRIGNRLAQLLAADQCEGRRLRRRQQRWRAANRGPLPPLWGPSRPCLRRRPTSHRLPLLHELGCAEAQASRRRRGKSGHARPIQNNGQVQGEDKAEGQNQEHDVDQEDDQALAYRKLAIRGSQGD
jgi:hypothetical protein